MEEKEEDNCGKSWRSWCSFWATRDLVKGEMGFLDGENSVNKVIEVKGNLNFVPRNNLVWNEGCIKEGIVQNRNT